ncbi:Phosphate ABC transporter, inner membrane subunit PstA [Tepidanaerobacter acetatoxydans Re1]|uniref:Phosphate transport system permease protein PstA n=1 Tax=Tepidanaerobacter acetatoxydans (strain DSM 21804 / JCM 16047 / Re1) TaxID=1209989 RepID=F4LRR2_TEPAE|nr:phosphate ABC transporter permease PstA [Tepidanaerobacter acetatoxydans]AEE91130.1 phosphate ABC transporter, inner membrane subunit PstA [Tepidanaerobacter acetatoxydans Re1]CCP25795.1 Phosphate ABC transporter, inner membrane subunit PstA [Tepidanaerobacter acetatoxydans Re1]
MKPKTAEKVIKVVLWLSGLLTFSILATILIYIISRGLNKINIEFLTQLPRRMGMEGGIYPAILGTFYFTAVTIFIAAPMGIATAVYLTEYSRQTIWVKAIRFGNDMLSAVPSIVFGLFGFALFVVKLKPITGGWSILSGALTGVFMILPILIRASEEAIKAVPQEYKEGSLALGASKEQTVAHIIIPAAMPGIITGIILGIGRIIGETAAFLLTLGGSVLVPHSIFDPARTLAMHIYLTAMEVGALDAAFGTAAVLIITILILNMITHIVLSRYSRLS